MQSTKSAMAALFMLLATGTASAGGVGEVALEITGLRNDRGEVLVALFRSPEGFPDGRYAFRYARVAATVPSLRVAFPGLPAGDYAIAVIHDEDRDARLDTNWMGIPREGYGASRNALPRFSAPTWKGNRFPVTAGAIEPVVIRVRY